jgi:hypothetical protein
MLAHKVRAGARHLTRPNKKIRHLKSQKRKKKERSPEWLIFTAVKWISFSALQTENGYSKPSDSRMRAMDKGEAVVSFRGKDTSELTEAVAAILARVAPADSANSGYLL